MACSFRRGMGLVSVLLLVLVIPANAEDPVTVSEPPSAKPAATKVQKSRVLVTISKETTWITEPLRPDGYPDYVAALNQRCSQGVTPENNAAVLFWKAMGPSSIQAKYRDQYFKMLGIPPLPEKGAYFVAIDDYVKLHEAELRSNGVERSRPNGRHPIWSDFEVAVKRPWTKDEFRLLADWLAANEKPLNLIVEASKRARRYDPMISEGILLVDNLTIGDAPVLGILLPAITRFREDAAMPLLARAMQCIRDGRIDAAWEDLLACHRLARLMGQGSTVCEMNIAFDVDRIANTGDIAMLQYAKPTAAQIKGMQEDLRRLPPMPKLADKIDVSERYAFLDSVAIVAKNGLGELFALGSVVRMLDDSDRLMGMPYRCRGLWKRAFDVAGRLLVDWDSVLRMGNAWYDKEVEACRRATQGKRKETLVKIDNEVDLLVDSAKDLPQLAVSMLLHPFCSMSDWTGHVFVGMFLPKWTTGQRTMREDSWMMESDLPRLAFSLAAYRADHGEYPAKLTDLMPEYIAEQPKDIFGDAELHYRREGEGYVLYSVGQNGKDDGGKTRDDAKSGEDWDDLVVRVPAEK